ncbi:hypothetical protein [Nitrosopumilus sp.]|uniref:hypothetical protein n=1 Tax=Nitrosopumilus sp. TaxID=2024843 RepID=UPI00260A5628|nr:hypothetical protein [Nitrosopumilus sp.]
MNNPSKLWQISIIFAGIVMILFSVAMESPEAFVFSLGFGFFLWVVFGYIEGKPELKQSIQKRLKVQ